jgi:hypothetical protein
VVCAFLTSWVLGATRAGASTIVGTITVDDYHATKPNDNQLGAELEMHYTLNDKFGIQECCKKDDLRWIQLAMPSKPFPGYPDRPFIDPLKNQSILGGNSDNLPFYDVTYANHRDVGGNKINRGLGPYFYDKPAASMNLWPVTVTFDTLLVCQDQSTMKMEILGGVQWGYSIKKRPKKDGGGFVGTTLKISQLDDSPGLEKQLNTALDLDYNGWKVVSQDKYCREPSESVNVAPEPSTALLAVLGAALGCGAWRPRRRPGGTVRRVVPEDGAVGGRSRDGRDGASDMAVAAIVPQSPRR